MKQDRAKITDDLYYRLETPHLLKPGGRGGIFRKIICEIF
jgi:hypothetical protein